MVFPVETQWFFSQKNRKCKISHNLSLIFLLSFFVKMAKDSGSIISSHTVVCFKRRSHETEVNLVKVALYLFINLLKVYNRSLNKSDVKISTITMFIGKITNMVLLFMRTFSHIYKMLFIQFERNIVCCLQFQWLISRCHDNK